MKITKEKNSQSDKKPLIFKKKRGGIDLSKDEIKYIKAERKKLRKKMKEQGLKSKQDFELTAASMGLYFDKNRLLGALWWLKGKALWALLGSALALLFVLFLASLVTQLRGHFTINLSSDMMKVGFTLSETADFANPTTQLYTDPVEGVPCISIASIPQDVDENEGNHSKDHFGYSFYLRNESDLTSTYEFDMSISSESANVSDAIWVMVFHNGELKLYAKQGADGAIESLPEVGINDRGYPNPWFVSNVEDKGQLELVGSRGNINYYRILPIPFVSNEVILRSDKNIIHSKAVDKFTVIVWLEGDDPECTDDLIDGHLGLEMGFRLVDEDSHEEEMDVWIEIKDLLDDLFKNLRFWSD